jgi:hypothetical protein
MTSNRPEAPGDTKGRWLTRNVFAIGLLSLFSDAGHELTTAILPLFLATSSGSAAALGVIEGFSDASSSLLKLWMSLFGPGRQAQADSGGRLLCDRNDGDAWVCHRHLADRADSHGRLDGR